MSRERRFSQRYFAGSGGSPFWGYCLRVARYRNSDELVVARSQRLTPQRLHIRPMLQPQKSQDGDLIARLEFGTAHAILPRLQGKRAALDFVETDLPEELHHVSKCENGLEFIALGLLHQRFHQLAAHTVRLGPLVDRQRADFA